MLKIIWLYFCGHVYMQHTEREKMHKRRLTSNETAEFVLIVHVGKKY